MWKTWVLTRANSFPRGRNTNTWNCTFEGRTLVFGERFVGSVDRFVFAFLPDDVDPFFGHDWNFLFYRHVVLLREDHLQGMFVWF